LRREGRAPRSANLGRAGSVDLVSGRQVVLCGDSHLTASSSRGVTKLDPRLSDAGWGVKNLAVGGATSRDAIDQLEELPPGPTVYSFGTNDAAPWKQVPLEEFGRNYTRLLRMSPGHVIVLSPSPVLERAAWPRRNDLQRQYSDVAAAVTSAAGGTFINLFELLGDREEVLLNDGIHLSDIAYEQITQVVIAALVAQ
jgi:lysophospholipase L1-like esterase